MVAAVDCIAAPSHDPRAGDDDLDLDRHLDHDDLHRPDRAVLPRVDDETKRSQRTKPESRDRHRGRSDDVRDLVLQAMQWSGAIARRPVHLTVFLRGSES